MRQGEPIRFQVDLTQNTDGVEVTGYAQLVNDWLINYPDTSYVTKRGNVRFINTSFVVPEFAPPGKYILVLNTTYHMNPLRDITIQRQTEEFQVVVAASQRRDQP